MATLLQELMDAGFNHLDGERLGELRQRAHGAAGYASGDTRAPCLDSDYVPLCSSPINLSNDSQMILSTPY